MNCAERYDWACDTESDINLHIPTMFKYALKCSNITEFGVRTAVSTAAWQMAKPDFLTCYDVTVPQCLPELEAIAKETECNFRFLKEDTRHVTINPTDLLFVDTQHHYAQLKREIWPNHSRVRRFMLFHDTETYGRVGDAESGGLMTCLEEFLREFQNEWAMTAHSCLCNGLTVLARI